MTPRSPIINLTAIFRANVHSSAIPLPHMSAGIRRTFPHVFDVGCPATEEMEWCIENLGDSALISWDGPRGTVQYGIDTRRAWFLHVNTIFIADEAHAAAFKMRFC